MDGNAFLRDFMRSQQARKETQNLPVRELKKSQQSATRDDSKSEPDLLYERLIGDKAVDGKKPKRKDALKYLQLIVDELNNQLD